MKSDLRKWRDLKQNLSNFEHFAHRHPMREYMKYLLSKHEIANQRLRDLDQWETWCDIRTKVCPDYDKLVECASTLFDVFDMEEYKNFYVEYRKDVLESNLDEDTVGDRLRRLEQKVSRIESMVKTMKQWMKNCGMKPKSKIEHKTP